ncbi:MAG: hypothetical protein KKI09_03525 [Spirochaetes bacterium]|nr:hypothetical protein [Spirochaetota bacterium]MBU0954477.1 hypothetical protein [Spirochaetota bacterium]
MSVQEKRSAKPRLNRRLIEGFIALAVLVLGFGYLGRVMGPENMINTITHTAHDLLLNTVFYLMAITVLVGALSAMMIEFGVVRIIERITAPFMKPLFGLPGVASLAGVLTFLSDNPAVISLARDKGYASYFKQHQLYSLANFGTAFGMGLIVLTYMMGLGFYREAVIGFVGAIIGALVSTRLMQFMVKRKLGVVDVIPPVQQQQFDEDNVIHTKPHSVVVRLLNALLDGGKSGLEAGMSIIPGVLIISTAVLMLTWGPRDLAAGYQGLAYEGVPVLPAIGSFLAPIFRFLFGFTNPEAIAFPVTSLGAVGAALGLIPRFMEQGLANSNDIAVFTAIGMCWSGYLSTHTGMMDALNKRELIGKALFSHTIGGIAAGMAAHYLFLLLRILNLA